MMVFPQESFIYRSQGSHSNPISEDYGWRATVGGNNQWFLASDDGVITELVDGKNYNPNSNVDLGNYYKLKMDSGETIRCGHCQKGSFQVKVGQRVKKYQRICKMGNSGSCTNGAYHTHMTFWNKNGTVVLPSNSGMKVFSKAVIYEGQLNLFEYEGITKPPVSLPKPVHSDDTKLQAEIRTAVLRARTEPVIGNNVIGFMPQGFYDVEDISDKTQENGYIWYYSQEAWYAQVDGVILHKPSDNYIRDAYNKAFEILEILQPHLT